MSKHEMRLAKVSPRYARAHGLNSNHHARVWCTCMDRPDRPIGFYSSRPQAEVATDPRRLGAFDHLGIVDLRATNSAVALFKNHLREKEA